MFFFAGGFVSPAIGLVFAVLHSIHPNEIILGQLSTFFLIASIPMLLFGSHVMDMFERKK